MLKRILDFLGFGNEKETIFILINLLTNPLNYLSNSKDEERSLIGILVFVDRLMFGIRILDVFIFNKDIDEYNKVFLLIAFLFAKQIAQLLLWFNGHLINIFVRILARKDDLMAAKRAYTFSSLIPNPLLYVYTLGSSLRHTIDPVLSTFVIYGVCWVLGTVLECIAIVRQYRLSIVRSIGVVIIPVIITAMLVFQIPFYLSVRFSPKIVKNDIDLNLLEFKRFKIDSTKDGSQFLTQSLLNISDSTSALIDTVFKYKQAPDHQLGEILEGHYNDLTKFLEITFVNKESLKVILPDFPIGLDSSAIDVEYSKILNRYYKSLILYASYLVNNRRHMQAAKVIDEILQHFHVIGSSNLGLVYSIMSVSYSKELTVLIDSCIPVINHPDYLLKYADVIYRGLIETEWVINSIRQEFYRNDAVVMQTSLKSWKEHRKKQDSTGFFVPDYTFQKFLDPNDSHEIKKHIWARIIKYSKNPDIKKEYKFHEIEELMKGGKLIQMLRFGMFKNTIGRILESVAVPLYCNYGHDTEDNRRYMEFVYTALITKAYHIDKNEIPSSIKNIILDLSQFKYTDTFSIDNNFLVSSDLKRFMKIYKREI